MRYGFVGAGELTAAVVEGLSAEVADPPAIFLSPRGRDIGRALASRFPNVRVCDSNQDVLEWLRERVAPAGEIVRSIPLPAAARRQSLTAMYPDNAVARELFDRVGGVLVPGDEAALDVFQTATATFAAHLDYLGTIATWLAEQGVDRTAATEYITHIFGQLGQTLLHSTDSLAALTDKHMTPGGINEQLMTDLRADGVPGMVRHALDRVLSRLRG